MRIVFRNPSVLVVDDDRRVRELIAAMAAQGGYQTLEAENGVEALHVAESNHIDLVITDVEMPGMSGPELIATLRKRGLIERSLLVTGNAGAVEHLNGLHTPVPFLAKPFNTGQLLGKIRSILSD